MSDTNNNFEELKRLLRLKQHEAPPPGYFNHFSGDVIARIRAGESEGSQGLVAQLQERSPFLANLLQLFAAKPGVIGGLATALCLLPLVAIVLADRPEPASAGSEPATAQVAPENSPAFGAAMPMVASDNSSGITISTNPMVSLQPVASLFGNQRNPLFQTASFMTGSQ
jgi:hypothetical protein